MKACRTCSEGKDPTQFRPSRPIQNAGFPKGPKRPIPSRPLRS